MMKMAPTMMMKEDDSDDDVDSIIPSSESARNGCFEQRPEVTWF